VGIVLFGLLLKMRTAEGTLVVEIPDPTEATIEVLDAQGKVVIEQKAGAEKVEISVVPGKGTLRVKKKDFELFTKEFSVVSGKQEIIIVKLVPKHVPPPVPVAPLPREVDLLKITGEGKNLRQLPAPVATTIAKPKAETRLATKKRDPGSTVVYTFKDRDAVLRDFDMKGDWDVASGELVLAGHPRSTVMAVSKAAFSFPLSIEYQMYFLSDRPYDLFPGFAGIRLCYATYANTRTSVKLGETWTRLPHVKALPNHLYRIVFVVDEDRMLAIQIDGRTVIRRHLDENVSLTGPLVLGPVIGHVACKEITVRTGSNSSSGMKNATSDSP
jgi:hypothetical protein